MADILEEILVDQNEEKKIRLLKSLLPYVISVTILLASLLFIYNWQQNKAKLSRMRLGDILVDAAQQVEKSQTFDVKILHDIIKNNQYKISELAALKEVEFKLNCNQKSEAMNSLTTIINNNKYDKVTISYAKIVWLSIMLNKDDLTPDERSHLEDYFHYFDSDKKPFYGVASIFKALWQIKEKQISLAQDSLKRLIGSDSVTPTIKELAQIIHLNLIHKGDL